MRKSHHTAHGMRAFGALCILSFVLGTQFPEVGTVPTVPDISFAKEWIVPKEIAPVRVTAVPVRLEIPAIHVSAEIEYVATDEENRMGVPKQWNNVGWYEPGTTPGDPGNAVIAGHLDSETGPAVFWNLKKLQPGDIVTVIDASRHAHHFEVEKIESYGIADAPMQEIFGSGDQVRLNLLTCGGDWKNNGYDERTVVYTKLIQ